MAEKMAGAETKAARSRKNKGRQKKDRAEGVNSFGDRLSKYRQLSDAELVQLVKSGEPQPFDELVRRHSIKIHDLCYKILRNYDDARDMAQETFIKAYRKITKFDGRSQFSTWLYRIAVNNCLNYLKKQRPTEEIYDEIVSSGKDDPVERYRNKKLREMIYEAVEKLPTVQRAVFTLRTLEDMSYQEVSDILKKPISTIKVNHHLAVKNLRNHMKAKL
ncbi:MAG: sigma-70 family RNA polymerase sigma factor [candidate division WOR-3 bacterium]|nr:MAG: sigma-70 family RNA polymerase sigma factor [candidate division WOR-3 bacterium]